MAPLSHSLPALVRTNDERRRQKFDPNLRPAVCIGCGATFPGQYTRRCRLEPARAPLQASFPGSCPRRSSRSQPEARAARPGSPGDGRHLHSASDGGQIGAPFGIKAANTYPIESNFLIFFISGRSPARQLLAVARAYSLKMGVTFVLRRDELLLNLKSFTPKYFNDSKKGELR